MTSPPDKLFRQGLEHYQKPAPGSAWERIESGLDRKRSGSPWMKIAAGLFLVVATTVLFLQFNQNETPIATVSKAPITHTLETDSTLAAATELQEIGNRSQETGGSEKLEVSILKSSNSDVERSRNNPTDLLREDLPVVERSRNEPSRNSMQSLVSTEKSVAPDESQLAATPESDKKSIELAAVSQVEITNEISIIDASSDSKRTSITYSAEEVNAKYLKKESTSEATPEKKNTSGLQKVIDLALDLKNEGSVLGDIREKKNEWLSINIPSNKREINK